MKKKKKKNEFFLQIALDLFLHFYLSANELLVEFLSQTVVY